MAHYWTNNPATEKRSRMKAEPNKTGLARKANSDAPEEIASQTEKSRPPRVVAEDRGLSQCSEIQPGRVGQTVGRVGNGSFPLGTRHSARAHSNIYIQLGRLAGDPLCWYFWDVPAYTLWT